MMNLLILSAGTRNKIVQYFKRELSGRGKVYATDCSAMAPAIYEADGYFLVPRITEPGYLERILAICEQYEIRGVFSLIDPELTLLAENREAFLAVGTTPVISSPQAVKTSFDKYLMYQTLRDKGIPTGRCYMDAEAFFRDVEAGVMRYPVFVKPARGSASIDIHKAGSRQEVELLLRLGEDMMIQEFMDGTEYGADVYVDMLSGRVTSIFVKEKVKMRAGETDKAVSFKDEALFGLLKNLVESMGFCGMIDVDIFRCGGKYYISEINPRFGGGYPHAYECGVNLPAQVIRNLEGKENEARIGEYEEGICMMKYCEVLIRRTKG